MLNNLKLKLEYVRMMDEKLSYLIIEDEECNQKFVLTGTEGEACTEIHKVITKIYLEDRSLRKLGFFLLKGDM